MEARPQCLPTDLDVRNTRLRTLSELHHEPVNTTHRAILAIHEFLI
jgi:hypothetical protein